MKNLSKNISNVIFYIVAAILVLFTSSMTIKLVGRILPEMSEAKYFALIIFDAGWIAWLVVFLNSAEGTGQRVTSLLLSAVDLIGVGLVALAEVFTGGQTLAEIPENIGVIAVWSLVGWTIINLVGVFVYHLTDPETMRQISQQNAQDKVIALSLQKLEEKMDAISDDVADELADDMKSQALDDLHAKKKKSIATSLPISGNHRDKEEMRQFDLDVHDTWRNKDIREATEAPNPTPAARQ